MSLFKEDLLKGQVAIVTGGGTGIGAEVAFQMGKLGASIAICGRRLDPLVQMAQKLEVSWYFCII
jgi:citronellol/citronellal dehydrogenase